MGPRERAYSMRTWTTTQVANVLSLMRVVQSCTRRLSPGVEAPTSMAAHVLRQVDTGLQWVGPHTTKLTTP